MSLPTPLPTSESVDFDYEQDVLTAYGIKISGALLRAFAEPTPKGHWFRVIKSENGVSTIVTRIEEEK